MRRLPIALLLAAALLLPGAAFGQSEGGAAGASADQDAETRALDSTATQWSFQFAHQWMFDYHQDTLGDGTTRPLGLDNYVQLRIVAPVPLGGLTILPRLTLRHYENLQTGETGIPRSGGRTRPSRRKARPTW